MPQLALTSNQPDGLGLRRLTFDQPLAAFDKPGQFVTVHLDGHKPAYFAIASEPGAPLELLVKVHGDAAEALAASPVGTPVEISEPIGHGFPLVPGDTRPLVVLATGSGLSGVRSVIAAEVDAGLPRPVTLLYGVYTPEHASYPEVLDAWREAGVDVRLVVSEDVDGWAGETGFVQDAAQRLGLVRADTTVVLCGYPQMVAAAKALWTAAGAVEAQLLTNF